MLIDWERALARCDVNVDGSLNRSYLFFYGDPDRLAKISYSSHDRLSCHIIHDLALPSPKSGGILSA